MSPVSSIVALEADGVSLILDASAGLPVVLHWGAALGELALDDVLALAAAETPPVLSNSPDAPLRLGLLPEGRTGWLGRPGLIGSRDDGRDWTPNWTLTAVDLDGAPARPFENHGPGTATFHATAPGLALELTVELLNTGLLRTRAKLTNTGIDPYRVDSLVLALPVPNRAREVLDFAGRWTKERHPQRTTLNTGRLWRENRRGRTGADSAYVLHLGTPSFDFANGEVWSVHTAWSGNHVHYAERVATGDQVIGGGELLLPAEGRLAPGDSYETPWLYGNYGHGLDALADRVHRWLRARPQHPQRPRPVTLNVWEAVYFDHNLDRLTELAERAAEVGVERFVLDDGWFGSRRDDTRGLGDWTVSPEVWPDGLKPLIERVNALDMEFGLWVEPEMINVDSDLARAHPDWILQPEGRLPVESRNQQVLDLTNPDAYAHIRDALLAILDEYDIAYLKWDHNRDLNDAGSGPGRPAAVHAQTLAYYRLVDDLKAAHPSLEIESCSSGGARIDLEVMQRCDRVWVSDCIDSLERQSMLRWTTQLLPPELLGSHVGSPSSHTTGRTHTLGYRAATAVWGHFGIEWDLTRATADDLAELTEWVAWHKANRTLLHTGRVVRADFPDAAVALHGVVSDGRALYELASTELLDVGSIGRLTLPGLNPDARYRVEVVKQPPMPTHMTAPWSRADEAIILSGRALAEVGVRAPFLPPEQSFIIEATRL